MLLRPESRALGQVLLYHHRATTSQHPPSETPNIRRYLLTYNVLADILPNLYTRFGSCRRVVIQFEGKEPEGAPQAARPIRAPLAF